jgi:hypothetical protein
LAIHAPTKTRGNSSRSHMHNKAKIVPKGRAEEEPEAIRRKLRLITVHNIVPGTKAAVYKCQLKITRRKILLEHY